MSKRFFSIVTCLALCLAIGTIGTALAEKTEIREVKDETIYVQSRISEEQAEREYLNGLFGLPVTPVEDLPRLRGTASGSQFEEGTLARSLYEALKLKVKAVAAGTVESTVFTFQPAEYGSRGYTREELGLSSYQEVWNYLRDEIRPLIEPVIQAVLYDCPYEMYWYDKTVSSGISLGASVADGQVFLPLTLSLCVNKDYSATGNVGTTDLNKTKIQSVLHAVEKAQEIIAENAGKGTFGRLTAYKNAICDLVDYNTAATGAGVAYGNPWQLVWVFDEDPSTTVVCEGYSKAFMYLCDETWKEPGTVDTICVSGTMYGSNTGPHMWNLVRMNGVNYLADITNSDEGKIGQFGGLFLDGYDSKEGDIYYYTTEGATIDGWIYSPGTVGYAYDEEMATTFAADLLNPADTAAEPQPYLSVSKSKTVVGENVTITAGLPGAGHIRVKSLKDYFVYDYEIQEGDTGEWTVSFDEPGEYSLSVDGWSDERWNNPEIPNVSEFPDVFGNVSVTVTVSYAVVPDSIVPGEDVMITIAPMEGAAFYEISIEGPTNSIIYYVKSAEYGNLMIPAMVFADGGNGYMINVYFYRENDDPESDWPYQEMRWESFDLNAGAYAGEQTLTITAGTYTDGRLPIILSVTDAEQVIIQEKKINNWGYECWPTVNVTDNPGATVYIEPLTAREHKIRAAVKKNGVWSAWSPVIEVTTPLHGRCNENIEWTLSDSGKLTISGTGEIPYEMDDSWEDFMDEITEVEIGSGITGIGNSAFCEIPNLTTVTIPATLTSIGRNTFYNCGSLTTITAANAVMTEYVRCYEGVIKTFSLPSTIEEIGFCAFGSTPEFGVNETVGAGFSIPLNTERIEENAFYGIKAGSVRMQVYNLNSCTIEDYAFGNCTKLRYFLIDSWGENVNYTITDLAFDGCTNLTFIGEENEYLREYAEDHGFMYMENEAEWGNG